LHLVGFQYYFTYTDDARSNTNHSRTEFYINWFSPLIIPYGCCEGKSLSDYYENKGYEQEKVLSTNTNLAHFGGSHAVV